MDIELPNGRVIQGVPDGTPKEEIMRKAIAAGFATAEDFGQPQAAQQPQQPMKATEVAPEPMVEQQAEPVPEVDPYQGFSQPQQSYGYQTQQGQPSAVPKQGSVGEAILGAGETALGLGSSAVAAPVAGLAGLADIATGGDLESATETIKGTQDALTYEPKTEKGKEYQQNIGEALQPVGEVLEDSGEYLGNETLKATGSWELAGLAQSIPEAVLELIGVKGSGRLLKPTSKLAKQPKAALSQSAPEIKQLRKEASNIYKEIDDAGLRVSKTDFLELGAKLSETARGSGFDPNLTPKIKGFLERLQNDYEKGNYKITDIDQLRRVAQVPANAIDNATEAAIGSKMIGVIDEFLDNQGVKMSERYGKDVGKKYRDARALTARVKKSETIDEAVFKAGEAASGFENGLRNEMRSILKNKKKRRGFTQDEIKAMQQITQGGTAENLFKKLGKLGYGADQQTNVLLSIVGAGAGAAAFGPAGVALAPAIGQVSARIAKKLGEKNAKFVGDITRAGKNGEEIAEAYIKNVPKRLQTPEELTALLADPSVDSSTVLSVAERYKTNPQLIKDAAFLTQRLRQAQLAGALAVQAGDDEQAEN
ncbi:coil containing protein [Vibrio phage 1.275.O._10N.286.54.E11]|nr:coil containing protein [Vibrio phage 1.275.O._10N.286.54.E11]